jgi:Ca-activated chloride channel family protein
VEFSPARVAVYRLIGNDSNLATLRQTPDAGALAALQPGQTVNAFYQVIPASTAVAAADATGEAAGQTPALALAKGRQRRATPADDALTTAENLLTVSLRWQPTGDRDTGVLEVSVPDRPQAWEQTSRDMQFGGAVALFGMLLRQSPHAAGATFDTVLALATPAAGRDLGGERSEFLELVRKARVTQQATLKP